MENLYPFLNGVLTEFKDGGLQLREDPNPPPTESVLILGTAVDGPVMEPVAVDAKSAYELFGKATTAGVPNGSTLIQAFEECWNAGCRDIRLMRISGSKATGQLTLPPIARTYEVVEEELLGFKSGNAQKDFVVSNAPIADLKAVYADGVQLPPNAYTVDLASGTVTLRENVCNQGASISIKYTYDNSGQIIEVTENSDVNGPWIAEGDDQTFQLAYEPLADTLSVFLDGVALDSAMYQQANNTLTIKKNAGRLGGKIEVSYSRMVVEDRVPTVKIESVFGGSVYNQTLIAVEAIKNAQGTVIGKKLIVTKPAVKLMALNEEPLEYSSLDYPTLGQLARAVNSDTRNNVIRLHVNTDDELLETEKLNEQYPTSLMGGSDGLELSRIEKYNKLQEAYKLLENYVVDAIVPAGVYADEEVPGQRHDMPFAYQLALACAVISHRNRRVTGYIATSSPTEPGLSAVEAHVQKLEQKSMSFNMRDRYGNEIADAEGNKIDLGGYICIVAGPDIIMSTNSRGVYAVNSAAALAGFVSTLSPESAPTNKVLPYVLGLRYSYGLPQLNRLVSKRFIVFRQKQVPNNPNATMVVVEDAPTAAAPTSDWQRLSTVRSVKACVDAVKEAADPFIGEPNSVDKRNALSAAIAKRLDALKQAGVIAAYNFQLLFTQAELMLGQLRIQLDIVPQFELRKITLIVGLTPEL